MTRVTSLYEIINHFFIQRRFIILLHKHLVMNLILSTTDVIIQNTTVI
jgi:hypothetical protein